MDIAIIGDEDAVLGFKLAGVKDAFVFDEQKQEQIIESCKESKIVIITENVFEKIKEKKLEKNLKGVIVEIPDKSGSKGLALQEISKLFETTIGVQLKKEDSKWKKEKLSK